MRKPESYLREIEKLRAKHSENTTLEKWRHNDTVQRKIIAAWEGYHNAISRQLDKAGCAVGNEHCDYSQPERIRQLVQGRDFFYRKLEQAERGKDERH